MLSGQNSQTTRLCFCGSSITLRVELIGRAVGVIHRAMFFFSLTLGWRCVHCYWHMVLILHYSTVIPRLLLMLLPQENFRISSPVCSLNKKCLTVVQCSGLWNLMKTCFLPFKYNSVFRSQMVLTVLGFTPFHKLSLSVLNDDFHCEFSYHLHFSFLISWI